VTVGAKVCKPHSQTIVASTPEPGVMRTGQQVTSSTSLAP